MASPNSAAAHSRRSRCYHCRRLRAPRRRRHIMLRCHTMILRAIHKYTHYTISSLRFNTHGISIIWLLVGSQITKTTLHWRIHWYLQRLNAAMLRHMLHVTPSASVIRHNVTVHAASGMPRCCRYAANTEREDVTRTCQQEWYISVERRVYAFFGTRLYSHIGEHFHFTFSSYQNFNNNTLHTYHISIVSTYLHL